MKWYVFGRCTRNKQTKIVRALHFRQSHMLFVRWQKRIGWNKDWKRKIKRRKEMKNKKKSEREKKVRKKPGIWNHNQIVKERERAYENQLALNRVNNFLIQVWSNCCRFRFHFTVCAGYSVNCCYLIYLWPLCGYLGH